jgi:hypothetical protein
VGLDRVQQRDDRELVEEIAFAQFDAIFQMREPLELIGGRRRTMP